MGELGMVFQDQTRIPFGRMRAWLEEAIDASEIPVHPKDTGGIRVVDLMQLRGITCRRLHLLGANSGMLPRPRRDDPILGDRLRRALCEQTERPLPLKEGAAAEERLLFALTLGAATERVSVSWQRADESGRAKTPSLALREVARLANGTPDVETLDVQHVPSHPTQALEYFLDRPGLLAPAEEVLLASLRSRGLPALAELGARFPDLAPGLTMLAATQSFEIVDPAFDGRVGPPAAHVSLSVSALERLGRCPLQHFFRDVLHVKELDEAARAVAIEPYELGSLVHELLQRIYAALISEGRFHEPLAELRRRAHELAAAERATILGDYGRRLARRLPRLAARLEETWGNAVVSFLDADLAWLVQHGAVPVALEQDRAAPLELGEDRSIFVHGRFDRVSAQDGRSVVSDYKTSGKLKDRCNVTAMLKGSRLQVPVYALLAGSEAAVELLGVGPGFDPEGETGYRFPFAGFTAPALRGFHETLLVLAELREQGAFPLRHGEHCGWCAYQQGCRHVHPPTEEREKQAADGMRYAKLAGKKEQKPLLADLGENA
jgi:ATP-dependent helicase/nuclease subunit B